MTLNYWHVAHSHYESVFVVLQTMFCVCQGETEHAHTIVVV